MKAKQILVGSFVQYKDERLMTFESENLFIIKSNKASKQSSSTRTTEHNDICHNLRLSILFYHMQSLNMQFITDKYMMSVKEG